MSSRNGEHSKNGTDAKLKVGERPVENLDREEALISAPSREPETAAKFHPKLTA